jgi:hypothetical protein
MNTKLLKSLYNFGNRWCNQKIHFVLFKKKEEKATEYYEGYALLSKEGEIERSSKFPAIYSLEEFEKVKQILLNNNIGFEVL